MINIYEERKAQFAMDDFMHHLKSLVGSIGDEMHAMGVENPNMSPAYASLQEFLGMEEDWRANHDRCPLTGNYKKKKSK